MSKIALSGNASGTGTLTIAAPNTNTDATINLPTITGGEFIVSNSSGNVGIGTASPAQALDVRGRIQVSNGTAGGQLGVDGGGLSISGIGSGPITFAANTFATNLARITSDGQQSSVIPGGSTLYNEYKCRAWVNFNGTGTVAIRASGNVSSITDNGTGDYTVNFTTAMPDANYCAVITSQNNSTTANTNYTVSYSTGAFRFVYVQIGVANIDQPQAGVAIFR